MAALVIIQPTHEFLRGPLNRCHELILRGTRLNDSPPAVAGIGLFTSIDKSERFQKGHIPPH